MMKRIQNITMSITILHDYSVIQHR